MAPADAYSFWNRWASTHLRNGARTIGIELGKEFTDAPAARRNRTNHQRHAQRD
jgi:hypothetical protein